MIDRSLVSHLVADIIALHSKFKSNTKVLAPPADKTKEVIGEIINTFETMAQGTQDVLDFEAIETYQRLLSIKEEKYIPYDEAEKTLKKQLKRFKEQEKAMVITPQASLPNFVLKILEEGDPATRQDMAEKWHLLTFLFRMPKIVGNNRSFRATWYGISSYYHKYIKGLNTRMVTQKVKEIKARPLPSKKKTDPLKENFNQKPKADRKLTEKEFDELNRIPLVIFPQIGAIRTKHQVQYSGLDDPMDQNKEERMEGAISALDTLIGLDNVKALVKKVAAQHRVMKIKEDHKIGNPELIPSRHLAFIGNPGTAKSTVAEILAKIYKEMGILSKGHFVRVTRKDLVAGYIGQSEGKTDKILERAKGGVLLIDEAYDIKTEGSTNDYGDHVITSILDAMEVHRDDLIVVFAGYPGPMKKFIESNPGLASRVKTTIGFSDYETKELSQILDLMAKQRGISISAEARQIAEKIIDTEKKNAGPFFGNGRFVRNLIEEMEAQMSLRLVESNTLDDMSKSDTKDVFVISKEDVNGIDLKEILSNQHTGQNPKPKKQPFGFLPPLNKKLG